MTDSTLPDGSSDGLATFRSRGGDPSSPLDDPTAIRSAVLLAGVTFLEEHGLFEGMLSMTAAVLAEDAHCSVASVYRNWSTKQALLLDVLEHVTLLRRGDVTRAVAEAFEDAATSQLPLGTMVRNVARATIDGLTRLDAVLVAMMASGPRLPDPLRELVAARADAHRKEVATMLRATAATWAIEPVRSRSAEDGAAAIVHAVGSILALSWSSGTRPATDRSPFPDAATRNRAVRHLTRTVTAELAWNYRPSSADAWRPPTSDLIAILPRPRP